MQPHPRKLTGSRLGATNRRRHERSRLLFGQEARVEFGTEEVRIQLEAAERDLLPTIPEPGMPSFKEPTTRRFARRPRRSALAGPPSPRGEDAMDRSGTRVPEALIVSTGEPDVAFAANDVGGRIRHPGPESLRVEGTRASIEEAAVFRRHHRPRLKQLEPRRHHACGPGRAEASHRRVRNSRSSTAEACRSEQIAAAGFSTPNNGRIASKSGALPATSR